MPSRLTRVMYATGITGPGADAFGPMATGDFPDVLAALERLAEAPVGAACWQGDRHRAPLADRV